MSTIITTGNNTVYSPGFSTGSSGTTLTSAGSGELIWSDPRFSRHYTSFYSTGYVFIVNLTVGEILFVNCSRVNSTDPLEQLIFSESGDLMFRFYTESVESGMIRFGERINKLRPILNLPTEFKIK